MTDARNSTVSDATSELGAVAPAGVIADQAKEEPFDFLNAASKRAFSESEVSQSITIRFLVESLKEKKDEVERLKPFQRQLYEVDRDLQIEKSKAKISKSQEVVSLCLTTIGGIGIGLATKFFDKDPTIAIAAFVLCLGLVATGVYFKVSTR